MYSPESGVFISDKKALALAELFAPAVMLSMTESFLVYNVIFHLYSACGPAGVEFAVKLIRRRMSIFNVR